jgi:hypothetical protein
VTILSYTCEECGRGWKKHMDGLRPIDDSQTLGPMITHLHKLPSSRNSH